MSGSQPPSSQERRRFLTEAARTAGGCAVAGSLLAYVTWWDARALPANALRPPGSLSACIRCGLCVRACPHETLRLAGPGAGGPATGTPFFTAREIPCEMCDDIPCMVACPPGAPDPTLDTIDDARMGIAVLVDQENCLNFQGPRCDVCYRLCPVIDEAITLETAHNGRSGHHALFVPAVDAGRCTGCGKYERGNAGSSPCRLTAPMRSMH